ncbi:hypothetical protein EDC94DRAFT_558311 [Helicostylum pulchrum]|nr:hypothetical protein EDC94DRAFT_558311 [Helicostylum pulchrum]
MDSEPLVSLKFEFKNQLQALFETIAPRHGHWLTRNREVNKTNTRAVEGLSEEAINACIFPKRAFTLVHDRSRSSHVNHDPIDVKELTTSCLPKVIKDWIQEQVKSRLLFVCQKTAQVRERILHCFFEPFRVIRLEV